MPPSDRIAISGARANNLKGVDLELPRDALIVITGLSGSGKSSLAFDTIYAEGQRRYVESLSAYARQFLGQMEKPDVDSIEGLSPAISIDQKTTSRNPRSTVGTVTEIYDYLRLLWARIGKPHCYNCGAPISGQSLEQITDRALTLAEGTRFMVMAPVVRGRKGEYGRLLEEMRAQGYARARIDGELHRLDEQIELDKKFKHDISVVVDRLVMKEGVRKRLSESVEAASQLADGLVEIETLPDGHPAADPAAPGGDAEGADGTVMLFSERFACLSCGTSMPELEPRIFSFNSPHGCCQRCHGLGFQRVIDPELIVPDPTLSISRGGAGSVDEGRLGLSPAAAGGRRRVERDRHRHPLAGPARARSRAAPGGNRGRASHGLLPQPLRPAARLQSPLRRHAGQPRATLREHRLGEHPGANRGAAWPCSPARPAAERACGRRASRSRSAGSTSTSTRGFSARAALEWIEALELTETERAIARLVVREIARAPALPRQRRDRLPVAGARGRDAVGRRGAADPARDPDRLGAGRRPLHPRRALDRPAPARQREADRHARAAARPRQHGDRGRARRGHDPRRRPRRRPRARAPASTAASVVAEGTPAQVERQRRLADRPVPDRQASASRSRSSAASPRGELVVRGRPPAQPQGRRRRVPARGLLLRHRASRARASRRWSTRSSTARSPTACTGRGCAPAPTTGSTASTRSTRSSTSTSRRSAARRARTRPPTPASSTTSASSSRSTRRRGRAATSRGGSASTSRAGAARSAAATARSRSRCTSCPTSTSPASSATARRYNRETLEVRFKGKSIADVLEMSVEEAVEFFAHIPKIHAPPADAPRRRPRLHPPRPAGDDALGRRGAARQARDRAVEGRDRRHPLHPRRADHRPALRRRAAPARGARPPGRRRQHRGRHRAQPRRDQVGRPDHRPRARGRRRRGRGRRHRHARAGRRRARLLHGPVPARPGRAGRASRAPPRPDPAPRTGPARAALSRIAAYPRGRSALMAAHRVRGGTRPVATLHRSSRCWQDRLRRAGRDRPRSPVERGDVDRCALGELAAGRTVARRFASPALAKPSRLPRRQAGVRGAALLAGLELAGGDEGLAAPRREVGASVSASASVQTAPENPFAQDVATATPGSHHAGHLRRRGDLAARKLLPAVYNLSLAGLLPDRFGVLGVSRRHDVPAFRKTAREAIEAHSRTGFDEDAWQALEPKLEVIQGDFGNPDLFEALAERLEARRRPPGRDPARLLPGRRSALLRPDRQGAGGGWPGRRRRSADPADDREAVRPRPRLGARAERRGGLGVRRVAGVPHRPLPRQGDGAEPPGAAVRQRHLRADLEPSLRRPRADHRGRGSRDRPPRRLLRLGRRDSRHDPEPRHAAGRARGRWSRRCASTPTRSATRR